MFKRGGEKEEIWEWGRREGGCLVAVGGRGEVDAPALRKIYDSRKDWFGVV